MGTASKFLLQQSLAVNLPSLPPSSSLSTSVSTWVSIFPELLEEKNLLQEARKLTSPLVLNLVLFSSGILIATNFSGSDSIGVWVFFIFMLITYGTLYWRDVRVDLNDMIAKEKKN